MNIIFLYVYFDSTFKIRFEKKPRIVTTSKNLQIRVPENTLNYLFVDSKISPRKWSAKAGRSYPRQPPQEITAVMKRPLKIRKQIRLESRANNVDH